MRIINHSKSLLSKSIMLLAVIIGILSCTTAQKQDINGNYKGEAQIIVNWSQQKEILFNLNIDSLGNVTGTIGDAQITEARVRKNTFGNTQLIINANLSGFLIENEKIQRESIKIPFDLINEQIKGGFGTSGSKIGNKETMIMTGTNLVLNKYNRENEKK